jgi:hypothetical protein
MLDLGRSLVAVELSAMFDSHCCGGLLAPNVKRRGCAGCNDLVSPSAVGCDDLSVSGVGWAASMSMASFEGGVMGIGEGRRSEGTDDDWGEGEPEIVEIAGGIVALIGGGEAAGDYGRLRWGGMQASSIAGEAREHDTAVSQAEGAERRRGSHVLADGQNEKNVTR